MAVLWWRAWTDHDGIIRTLESVHVNQSLIEPVHSSAVSTIRTLYYVNDQGSAALGTSLSAEYCWLRRGRAYANLCVCVSRMIDWLRTPRNSPFEATLRCPPSTLLTAHRSQHFKPPVLFGVRVIPFKWTPPTRYTSCSDRQLFVYAVGNFNGYIVLLVYDQFVVGSSWVVKTTIAIFNFIICILVEYNNYYSSS